MIKVHVVRAENSHLYQAKLEECFRLRHKIYVDDRRWLALKKPDGREIDQFDTNDTVYLIALDEQRIVGHMRMIPTDKPTLLSELFPQLSLSGPIRQPDAYEMSRIFVVRERRGEYQGVKIEALLQAAGMEYTLQMGGRYLTVVLETWWIPRMFDQGWQPKPLGLPMDIDGMSTTALIIDATEEMLASICKRRNIQRPSLVWQDLDMVDRIDPPAAVLRS